MRLSSNRFKSPFVLTGAVTAVAGLVCFLLAHPLGLDAISYDSTSARGNGLSLTNVVIVTINDASFLDLKSDPSRPFDRRFHIDLLNRLSAEKAELVFYDINFSVSNNIAGDQAFAGAMRKHGKVVLGAFSERETVGTMSQETVEAPLPIFRAAALGWGPLTFEGVAPGGVVRKITSDTLVGRMPSAARLAANAFAPAHKSAPDDGLLWLNYYSGDDVFPIVPFHRAVDENFTPAGFFAGKVVFIGENRTVPAAGDRNDQFASPFSLLGNHLIPGVELHALTVMNLARGDALIRWNLVCQAAVIAGWGMLIGAGVSRCRRSRRIPATVCFAVVMAACAWGITHFTLFWWCWAIPVFVQPPAALVASLCFTPQEDPKLLRAHFISYRRKDGSDLARNLRHELLGRDYDAWLDVVHMKKSTNEEFPPQLEQNISERPFFILILTRFAVVDLRAENDWMTREIRHARRMNRRIIVLHDNRGGDIVSLLQASPLPEDLHWLCNYPRIVYDHEQISGTIEEICKAST